ncbi:hypothetical protein LM599_00850 [Candidatus Acetothermia bacterium]|jgi:hypothetical protein|nr:hypothetical protein [Candidatus Acetothermia bacterium]MCI2427410.1 hypothetical protein [Candidatus Acetothermia bacterium]MCI2428565.1 hypothetical protein [Candidatus Acetothermia bacterium]
MQNQNWILIGIALFLALMVTITTVEHLLQERHDPRTPDGLIWHMQRRLLPTKDVDAILSISTADRAGARSTHLRLHVQAIITPQFALRIEYLDPPELRGQIFILRDNLLSHYLPLLNFIITRELPEIATTAIEQIGLDLLRLQQRWQAGEIDLRVVRTRVMFTDFLVKPPIVLPTIRAGFSSPVYRGNLSVSCILPVDERFCQHSLGITFAAIPSSEAKLIRKAYILEVRNAGTDELVNMIWVDHETFLIERIAFLFAGERTRTIVVEQITFNQNLLRNDILSLPQGIEIVHGQPAN